MIKSIVIDATHLSVKQGTGVEGYVDALLPDLSTSLLGKGVAVSWIGHGETAPAALPDGVRWICSPHRSFWSQTTLLTVLNAEKPDLFFTPSGLAPIRYRGATAITVHDMAAYLLPSAFSFGQQVRLRFLIHRNAIRASRILTPSEFSGQQISRIWDIESERITVTPLGYTPRPTQSEPILGIDPRSPLFLFVGRIERKKNLVNLVKAFGDFAASGQPGQLVLAGKDGYGASEVHEATAHLPNRTDSRITFTGYISDGQLAWLFSKAAACLVPCPVEGFGLPVLEAFAAKVPLICAAEGSLPEVGRDAALYAPADQPAEWSRLMHEVLTDSTSTTARVLKGTAYLPNYTWQRTVQLTVDSFMSL
ncbi:MAG: glycosyltransferase family 1 protein [bacterium]